VGTIALCSAGEDYPPDLGRSGLDQAGGCRLECAASRADIVEQENAPAGEARPGGGDDLECADDVRPALGRQ
jgi:hypothetical protein